MNSVSKRISKNITEVFSVFVFTFVSALLIQLSLVAHAYADESCDCAQLSCAPCETETDTTFYSAKCGPGGSKVKSCKKPTCVAVEEQEQCLADLKSGKASTKKTAHSTQKPGANKKGSGGLQPAAAKLLKFVGGVRVVRGEGRVEQAAEDLLLYQGDTIETKADGKVHVVWFDKKSESQNRGAKADGSEMVLPPNTRLRIEEASFQPSEDHRSVVLNLLAGKVRNHVTSKYTGENKFRVKAGAAVAGVRGTDFITSFDPSETKWTTQVFTLDGNVNLAAEESKPGEPLLNADIPAGQMVAYFVAAPPPGSDDDAIAKISAGGQIGNPKAVSDAELREMRELLALQLTSMNDRSSGGKAGGKDADLLAKADGAGENVCTSPSGQFNQCSFTCEGNPKGEATCRTDLKGVKCVRRLCRANGKWEEEHVLPRNQSVACDAKSVAVRACGQYW